MKRLTTFMCALMAMAVTFSVYGAEPILLKAGTIRPESGTSSLHVNAAALQSKAIADRGLYIIQHDGLITPDWREQLEEAGATIHGYIPENAYLIEASSASYLTIISTVAYTYFGDYKPEYRCEPAILSTSQTKSTSADDKVSVPDYDILLFNGEMRLEVSERIASLPGCAVVSSSGKVIRAKLTDSAIREIASWIEVRWIERYVAPTLSNNVAVQSPRMNVQTVWPDGGTGLGLTGKGQIVAVADTGLDTGNTSTLHEDVKGRIVSAYALGRSYDWSDPDGHGTHVVGSVLGNGSKSSGSIKGVAYEAKLVFQSTLDSQGGLGGIPSDLNILFQQAYDDGARIHSNSWGAGRQENGYAGLLGCYSGESRAVDEFMFDHPDMLILFAAGNDGVDWSPKNGVVDEDSICSQPTAKNCLTVGASENLRTSGNYSDSVVTYGNFWSDDFPVDPLQVDHLAKPYKDTQGMVAFSGRGPCDDGRIKPDVVAPGSGILSLLSSNAEEKPGTSSVYYYNSYYQYMQGTSMACPLVAGSAALVRQWLVEKKGISNPDGATIKAVLLAGAKSLAPGQYGTGSYREIPASYPNNVEGWGQVNLGNSVKNAKGLLVYDGKVIRHGETQTFKVTVASAGSPLNIVMAYTDAPPENSTDSPQLVNDLDLTVTSPSGTKYYPNSRDYPDRVNNVEGVRISGGSVEAGVYTIEVKGYKVVQGMSTSFTGGKTNAQRYSLVVNGATDKIEKCTITFDANGGSGSPVVYTRNSGEAIGTFPTVTWSPHTFIGWFTERSGGSQIYEGTIVSESRTYYAHWQKKQYQITFVANGGSLYETYRMVDYCATYGTLPTPTWTGHDFLGWFTKKTGGTQVTADMKCTGNKTVYAQWKIKQYKLTFSAQGGSVSPAYMMVNYCATYSGPLPMPTWGGHEFLGWYTAKTDGELFELSLPWKCTGNKTIYAHWKLKQYKLTLNANNGVLFGSVSTMYMTDSGHEVHREQDGLCAMETEAVQDHVRCERRQRFTCVQDGELLFPLGHAAYAHAEHRFSRLVYFEDRWYKGDGVDEVHRQPDGICAMGRFGEEVYDQVQRERGLGVDNIQDGELLRHIRGSPHSDMESPRIHRLVYGENWRHEGDGIDKMHWQCNGVCALEDETVQHYVQCERRDAVRQHIARIHDGDLLCRLWNFAYSDKGWTRFLGLVHG